MIYTPAMDGTYQVQAAATFADGTIKVENGQFEFNVISQIKKNLKELESKYSYLDESSTDDIDFDNAVVDFLQNYYDGNQRLYDTYTSTSANLYTILEWYIKALGGIITQGTGNNNDDVAVIQTALYENGNNSFHRIGKHIHLLTTPTVAVLCRGGILP